MLFGPFEIELCEVCHYRVHEGEDHRCPRCGCPCRGGVHPESAPEIVACPCWCHDAWRQFWHVPDPLNAA